MDRYWLLTWTTYGAWLPGDERGFVGRVRDARPLEEDVDTRREHDIPYTDYDADLPGLEQSSRKRMKGEPIWLDAEDGAILLVQFRETAERRHWQLLAAAVMANHVHLVVGVPGDPDPADLLRDFKSYASRRLTERHGPPRSGRWWTQSGSRRKLPDEAAVRAAIEYVRRQYRPLAMFIDETI
jgi:REP element-mobilizing transposase RayT